MNCAQKMKGGKAGVEASRVCAYLGDNNMGKEKKAVWRFAVYQACTTACHSMIDAAVGGGVEEGDMVAARHDCVAQGCDRKHRGAAEVALAGAAMGSRLRKRDKAPSGAWNHKVAWRHLGQRLVESLAVVMEKGMRAVLRMKLSRLSCSSWQCEGCLPLTSQDMALRQPLIDAAMVLVAAGLQRWTETLHGGKALLMGRERMWKAKRKADAGLLLAVRPAPSPLFQPDRSHPPQTPNRTRRLRHHHPHYQKYQVHYPHLPSALGVHSHASSAHRHFPPSPRVLV